MISILLLIDIYKTDLQISPSRNVYPLVHCIEVDAVHTFWRRYDSLGQRPADLLRHIETDA